MDAEGASGSAGSSGWVYSTTRPEGYAVFLERYCTVIAYGYKHLRRIRRRKNGLQIFGLSKKLIRLIQILIH